MFYDQHPFNTHAIKPVHASIKVTQNKQPGSSLSGGVPLDRSAYHLLFFIDCRREGSAIIPFSFSSTMP
jgi:hypothetical protein